MMGQDFWWKMSVGPGPRGFRSVARGLSLRGWAAAKLSAL